MKKKKKGFTLVELLVVIAIIAILAAIIAPNAFKAIEKSKVATAEADYKAIKTAALSYYSDTGAWPVTSTDTIKDSYLVTENTATKAWNGPYLEKWPTKNPWGGSYKFLVGLDSGDGNTFGTMTNCKSIKLTNVNEAAINRLEADLDGDSTNPTTTGIVRSNGNTVYLIISEQ